MSASINTKSEVCIELVDKINAANSKLTALLAVASNDGFPDFSSAVKSDYLSNCKTIAIDLKCRVSELQGTCVQLTNAVEQIIALLTVAASEVFLSYSNTIQQNYFWQCETVAADIEKLFEIALQSEDKAGEA